MGLFRSGPIERLDDGKYRISLSDNERAVLRALPLELYQDLEGGDDNSGTYRLFPPGYSQDILRQAEYDSLMRDELTGSHLLALKTLMDTATAVEIDEDQLAAWTRAINQLRLVLGTRMEITADTTESDFPQASSESQLYSLYLYLGYLQEEAVEALSSAL